MFNELERSRPVGSLQFWFFTYNTGNRSPSWPPGGCCKQVVWLDPEEDPASGEWSSSVQQGGLTKFTVIDTGNAFWDNASRCRSTSERVPETGSCARPVLQASSFVETVIFVATPHGSFVLQARLDLARKLITLPFRLLDLREAEAES
jgi:hypothetical protein